MPSPIDFRCGGAMLALLGGCSAPAPRPAAPDQAQSPLVAPDPPTVMQVTPVARSARNSIPDRAVPPAMSDLPAAPTEPPPPPLPPRRVILPSPTQPPAEVDPVLPDPGDRVPL